MKKLSPRRKSMVDGLKSIPAPKMSTNASFSRGRSNSSGSAKLISGGSRGTWNSSQGQSGGTGVSQSERLSMPTSSDSPSPPPRRRRASLRPTERPRHDSYEKGRSQWLRAVESKREKRKEGRDDSTAALKLSVLKGIWVTKHHYMQRTSVVRWLYIDPGGKRLCWRSKWGFTESSISLNQVVGLLVGTKSKRFHQMILGETDFLRKFPPWRCCSIVLPNRTVDITIEGEGILVDWVLALQTYTDRIMFKWKRSSLARILGWIKLRYAIKVKGMKKLIEQFKAATYHLRQEHVRLTRSVWSVANQKGPVGQMIVSPHEDRRGTIFSNLEGDAKAQLPSKM
ncbi:hypothetical protein AAMO2058_000496300 [Amorphochlora amoebiformis]